MSLAISEKIELSGHKTGVGEFERLVSELEELTGYSSFFVFGDSYSRQKNLYKELGKELSRPIKLVELKKNANPLEVLEIESSKSQDNEVFYILGLDLLLEDLNPDRKAETLGLLEDNLDGFVELNRPLVFAIPIHLISVLQGNAPAFWDWHQGIFLFEEGFEQDALQLTFVTDHFVNLFGGEKYKRKKELLVLFESFIKEYQLSHTENYSISFINYLGHVALLFHELADFKKALSHYHLQLERIETLGNDLAIGILLNNIGRVYQSMGQYYQAKGMYKRALKKCRKAFREKFIYKALILNNIGWIEHLLGDDKEALRHCHHALGTLENNFNPYQTHLAPVLNLMGNLNLSLGDDEEALECFRRVLQICEKNEGLEHPYIALIMHTIGKVYLLQQKYEDAIKYFYGWSEKIEKYYGSDHPQMAMHVLDMGEVFFLQGEYEKALEYFNWALQTREKALEKMDDPDSAKILYYLGKTLLNQNKMDEAENYLNAAWKVFEKKLPAEHPLIKDYQSEIKRIRPEVPGEIADRAGEKGPKTEKQTEPI
ncbi:MAG: hypothetical protein AMJ53_01730 [Gammaproteobacteria bacterium SG8_11]|nr:MAG: hypothetical protein AMJ53_01730 [Gammaproteobacteria bacterium SG8_11]